MLALDILIKLFILAPQTAKKYPFPPNTDRKGLVFHMLYFSSSTILLEMDMLSSLMCSLL